MTPELLKSLFEKAIREEVESAPKAGQVWEFRPDEGDRGIWDMVFNLNTFPERLIVESYQVGWGKNELVVRAEKTNEPFDILYHLFRILYRPVEPYRPTVWERLAAVTNDGPVRVER